jgi:hypothetical protein
MPSSADGDEALLQQAAERARALIAALNGDAQSLRQHQEKDASLAEGVDAVRARLARRRAASEAVWKKHFIGVAAPVSASPSPDPNPEQERS